MDIDDDKNHAIKTLENGIARSCADDIAEVLVNLEDNTCNYVELIPILQRIAGNKSFYYFDDNGAGGFPHADYNRKASFRLSALEAIENIRENARFEADSPLAKALKSNSTQLIKAALESLQSEGVCADKSLIPILEKIARKDVYKSYSYFGGLRTECRLGEVARNVIQIILRNAGGAAEKIQNLQEQKRDIEDCALCGVLPDDLTVNSGREEYLPGAFNELVGVDGDFRAQYLRCPSCGALFNYFDLSSWTGSGNNDEERLVRLPGSVSRLIDNLFSDDPRDHPNSQEVEKYLETLPLKLLLSALKTCQRKSPQIVAPFVPHLMRLFGKNHDYQISDLLRRYVSDKPERAEEIMKVFPYLTELYRHCLKVVEK